jgi:hypothetical protein
VQRPALSCLHAPHLADLEAQLRGVLATKVGIVRTRRGGRLVIDFYSDEELDRLYAVISRGVGAAHEQPPTAPVSMDEASQRPA